MTRDLDLDCRPHTCSRVVPRWQLDAWDVENSVLYCRGLIHFSHSTAQYPLKTPNRSKIFTWSLQFSMFTFTLLFEYRLLLGNHTVFHKIQYRATLSRSHSDLDAADNVDQPRASHQLSSINACGNWNFCFWNFFWYFLFIFFYCT
jgi:hypothetical protein